MAQEQSRFSLVLGDDEEQIVGQIRAHLGSRTSKAAAIQYALHEWRRRNKDRLLGKVLRRPALESEGGAV